MSTAHSDEEDSNKIERDGVSEESKQKIKEATSEEMRAGQAKDEPKIEARTSGLSLGEPWDHRERTQLLNACLWKLFGCYRTVARAVTVEGLN